MVIWVNSSFFPEFACSLPLMTLMTWLPAWYELCAHFWHNGVLSARKTREAYANTQTHTHAHVYQSYHIISQRYGYHWPSQYLVRYSYMIFLYLNTSTEIVSSVCSSFSQGLTNTKAWTSPRALPAAPIRNWKPMSQDNWFMQLREAATWYIFFLF